MKNGKWTMPAEDGVGRTVTKEDRNLSKFYRIKEDCPVQRTLI